MQYNINVYGLTYRINSIKSIINIEQLITTKIIKKYGLDKVVNVLENNNFKVNRCKICKNPIRFKIKFNESLQIISVEEIKKYKGYQYCYGFNSNCPGKKMNSNSAEFISIMHDITYDEALIYIKNNNKSSFYRENFKNDTEYKESQSRNLSYFIKRYGETQGALKYKNTLNKQNYSRSLDGYIKKHGQIEGRIKFENYCKSKNSMSRHLFDSNDDFLIRIEKTKQGLVSFIKRYGNEEGLKLYQNYIEKRSNTFKKNIEKLSLEEKSQKFTIFDPYKLIKLYNITISEANDIINKRKDKCKITLKNQIEKYGEYEGTQRWIKICSNRRAGYSKWSTNIIYQFLKIINIDAIDKIYFGDLNREYGLYDNENSRYYFYDFVIFYKNKKKLIIEFNGSAFHPHPHMLNEDKLKWRHAFSKESYETVLEKNILKRKRAIADDFLYFEVWDTDVDSEIINKIINFINHNV